MKLRTKQNQTIVWIKLASICAHLVRFSLRSVMLSPLSALLRFVPTCSAGSVRRMRVFRIHAIDNMQGGHDILQAGNSAKNVLAHFFVGRLFFAHALFGYGLYI